MITLVIIGVIASMTIPTLINKTNNQEYVSRLKKAYSTLSQATNQIVFEEGTPNKENWANSSDNVYELYKKHLSIAKDCGFGAGCFYDGFYRHIDGSLRTTFNYDTLSNIKKIVLSDGSSVAFDVAYAVNGMTWLGIDDELYITILVDINGKKGPNQIGRDMFMFVVKNTGLYPAGVDAVNLEDKCNSNGSSAPAKEGWGCAGRVIKEGAMNY